MFDFSWSHMVVIAVVALVVIGPKELPTVLRTVGQWVTRIRRMAAEFQGQFQEALREAEMADLKQHFDDISTAAKDIPRFDPIGTVRKEIEDAVARPSPSAEPAAASTPATDSLPPAAAGAPEAADALPEPAGAPPPAATSADPVLPSPERAGGGPAP